MRILVTGSSGHVGQAIAEHLANAGHEVVGLDLRPGGPTGLIQQIEADIASENVASRICCEAPPCAAIVHTAAALGKDLCAPAISLTNCLGTQQMIRLACLWGATRFIYTSGVPVIGLPQQLPITEEHPVHPPTAYHASKLYGEHLVRLAERDGLIATILRLTSPVGPNMPDNRILSIFVRRALANERLTLVGQGTRRQNYVDVRDVALAVEACLCQSVSGLFNVASNRSISNHELAQLCVSMLASSSPIEFTGNPDPEEGVVWDVSIARAAERFGYHPHFTIEDSIRAVSRQYAHRVNQ